MTERRDVYFEHLRHHNVIKCTAIDGLTGLEVCVVGPVMASQRQLEQLALAKLKKRLQAQTS